MILSAKSTGRLSRLHGSRRGARTRTANGSHDQLVATISLPMAAVPRERDYAFRDHVHSLRGQVRNRLPAGGKRIRTIGPARETDGRGEGDPWPIIVVSETRA